MQRKIDREERLHQIVAIVLHELHCVRIDRGKLVSGSSTGCRYGPSINRSAGIQTSGNDGRIGTDANANGSISTRSVTDSATISSSV